MVVEPTGVKVHEKFGEIYDCLTLLRTTTTAITIHHLLPVGSKLHKCVHFGSCSGHDFSIVVQSISKGFTVLESVIQELHLLLRDALHIFAP